MRYVATYDVDDDRVRSRLATLLEACGTRVQESVFECTLDEPARERLLADARREIEACERGELRLYRLCADCLEASVGVGRLVVQASGRGFLVV